VRAGDTVQIIPKARYIAWRNFVQEAEIEVFGEDTQYMSVLPLSSAGNTEDGRARSAHSYSIYRPLNESLHEIRLIKLQSGAFSDELSCTIEYASLDESHRTPYEGLSYCWGDLNDTKWIKVWCPTEGNHETPEHAVAVTSNLHDALKHIRRDDGECRVLWIDAICINQDDLYERSQQVAMMRQIYAQAVSVNVWLGRGNTSVHNSIQDARYVMKRYQDAMPAKVKLDATELHHPLLKDGFYLTDSPLFEHDWFRRSWVLQEVFNAKALSVYCGKDVLSWSMVLRLNHCINRSMLVPNPIRKNVMPSLFAGLFDLDELKTPESPLTYAIRQARIGILDVLLRGLDLDATDPRDKIFALLQFGEETSRVSKLPAEIRPDYQKCTAKVFADFTRWWIMTHRSLRILSAVHASVGRTWQRLSSSQVSSTDENRASWSLWHDGKGIWARGTLGFSPSTPYRAAGHTVPDVMSIYEVQGSLVLPLLGRQIGVIERIGPYPYYADSSEHRALHVAYHNIFDPINSYGTWNAGIQQDDLHELQRLDDPEELRNKLVDHLYAHINCAKETAAFECHPPCFLSTPDGTIGLCPPAAQEGDMIVVLQGGCVPYILRPKHATSSHGGGATMRYTFVGECYLEGYMHGRAVQEQEEGGGSIPTRIFELA
jgi:hypothetical protein